MKVEKFEDVEAWQKARELCNEVYKATSGGEFSRSFALRDQVDCSVALSWTISQALP